MEMAKAGIEQQILSVEEVLQKAAVMFPQNVISSRGQTYPEEVCVCARLVFYCRLGNTFSFFTLGDRSSSCLDVIVKSNGKGDASAVCQASADYVTGGKGATSGFPSTTTIITAKGRLEKIPEGYALHAQELFVQGFQPPSEQHGAQAGKDASEAAATSPAKESATRQTGNWRNRDGSRKGAKKLGRAGKFVEKLVEIFGHDRLAGSSVGVLDVAGGSGDVAFELSVRRGIPCTIIDPRATTAHTKRQMRVLRHRRRSQQILSKGTEVSPLARHVYGRFSSTEANVLAAEFHADFGSTEEGARLMKECTAIIGMHPDQATDAIVDVAIQVEKPYAIVPCCVFAKKFPHRKLPGSERSVKSYEDLLHYLQAKGEGNSKTCTLDFEGRNFMIFADQ